ncbi:MAG TPA: mechanosensitive ion channel family protein [Steroidobacteraceae bacterium]|nr:mechanosensitive ion channel family protein [Steroidobacteraceae bacterium]
MSDFGDLGHVTFLGNSLAAWALALAIFLVTLTVLPLVRRFLSARRRRLGPGGPAQVLSAMEFAALLAERTNRLFLWAIAVWLGSRDLLLPPRIERWLTVALVLLFWMQVALWGMAAVRYAIELRRARSGGPDTLLSGSLEVILFVAGLVIWTFALLLALDNLGVQIKPLLAGLGIGGIALALAVQTVLADLLASLSIALDRPFGVGDFLALDDYQGTVEHIGVKSTRLRSLSGEQIVIANGDIVKARLRNYGRMRERRVLFQLGVDYGTPVATLAAIPRAVREIIEATPDTRFERCHLLTYGANALQFEVVYYLTNPDYAAYVEAQQRINLRILERFSVMEVNLAAAQPTAVRLAGPLPDRAGPGGQQRLL